MTRDARVNALIDIMASAKCERDSWARVLADRFVEERLHKASLRSLLPLSGHEYAVACYVSARRRFALALTLLHLETHGVFP